jgi:hypothetical protein
MNLTPFQQAKIDPLLREVLTNAGKDEQLQVIIILQEDNLEASSTNQILPSEFPSRAEYRKALIERRKQQLAIVTVEQAVTALQDLSIDIQWQGETSRALVAKGLKSQIVEALKLPCVKLAIADQVVELTNSPTHIQKT